MVSSFAFGRWTIWRRYHDKPGSAARRGQLQRAEARQTTNASFSGEVERGSEESCTIAPRLQTAQFKVGFAPNFGRCGDIVRFPEAAVSARLMNHFADAKPATLMTRGDVIRLAFEVVSMGAGRESAATTNAC